MTPARFVGLAGAAEGAYAALVPGPGGNAAPDVSRPATVAVAPSPHPGPGTIRPAGARELPVPAPQTGTAPDRPTNPRDRVSPGTRGSTVAGADLRDDMVVPDLAGTGAEPGAAAHGLGAAGLHQSLIYTGALGLAVAAAGIGMVGCRRRLW